MGFYPFAFSSASKPKVNVVSVENFKGLDLRNTPATVDKTRSPDAVNMLRDEIGQVRKRMGFQTVKTYSGQINGVYHFGEDRIVHAGDKLYKGTTQIGTMNNAKSKGWMLGGKLYLLDGAKLRRYDGTSLVSADTVGYIPTVIISRNPTGGGTAYEDINLIAPGFINSFYTSGTGTTRNFQLTDGDLDATAVTAQVMTSDGVWEDKVENTDFTVNRTTGKVTFATGIAASPVMGEDNVKITAYKTRPGYADQINKCTISTLFGVAGAADRLFVSGNPDYPNRDWHSQMNDPTFFGDLAYSLLGQDDSAVMGYSVVADRLAAHKEDSEDGRNVVVRSGVMQDGEPAFPIVSTLQGEGCVSQWGCAYLGREPLFVTKRGIFAITAEDITGEKYSQNRSSFLNPKLIEEDLSGSFAFVYHDFYWLFCPSGRVYLLDALQKSYSKNEPYSTFQYEGYLLSGISARVAWEEDGALYFGTSDGKLCKFYEDKNAPVSYQDDGAAVPAYWTTPYFSGKVSHNRKDFQYLSVSVLPGARTGLRVDGQIAGAWKLLFESYGSARYFDFSQLDFAKLSFLTDTSPRTVYRKINARYVDKLMLRFESDAANEPLGIYGLTLEFMEGGHF